MSSVELLDNTRRLNAILHRKNSGKVVFNDICAVLCDVLCANVLVLSKKGKILGKGIHEDISVIETFNHMKVGNFVEDKLNGRLADILSTKENVNLEALGFSREESQTFQTLITPINISGERFGCLIFYKYQPYVSMKNVVPSAKSPFCIEDIIMCEYGATVVGLEMLRSVSEESAQEERRLHGIKTALGTLSSSELEAVVSIFDELKGCEGVLVASRIADRAGITRSVIVNALRKLESAEIIQSKSAGMKGTYIKILNPLIVEEVKNIEFDGVGKKELL